MEDFTGHIIVDSNVIDERTTNTISSFRNYTPSQFRYSSEDFEIGLVELHLPYSWNNLRSDSYIGLFDVATDKRIYGGLIKIDANYYDSLTDLIMTINEKIEQSVFAYDSFSDHYPANTEHHRKKNQPFFYIDDWANRIKFEMPAGAKKFCFAGVFNEENRKVRQVYPRFTPELGHVLGFPNQIITAMKFSTAGLTQDYAEGHNKDQRFIFRNMPQLQWTKRQYDVDDKEAPVKSGDNVMVVINHYNKQVNFTPSKDNCTGSASFLLDFGIPELFIYTNLIKAQMVGNSQRQLLRVVPVYPTYDQKKGENIILRFDKPFYYPFLEKSFDYIEIDLRDREGELITFQSGGVIAILEIKRKDGIF